MNLVSKLAAVSAVALGALVGAVQAQTYIVVHHSDGTDPFWPVVNRGAEEAGQKIGATVEIRHPQRVDAVEMAQIIETAIAQNPDGLVVSIPDGDVIGPVIRKAVEAGIPVVSMNSGNKVARDFGVLFHVGQPEFEAGQGAGGKAKAAGVTKHFCIIQEAANNALRERCRGYADALGVDENVVESTNDPAEIKARASAYLASNPEVNGILATGPHVCPPVQEAIAENGLDGQIHLGCFDLTPAVIDMIKSGQAAYAVDQQQYLQGYMPIIALDLYNKFGLVPGGDILSGPGFVTKENADQTAELAGKYR
jgi:simple sugar transport system substrate-binding protein